MNILHFNTLPSTYTYVAEHARSMASDTVVAADYQSAGRGQRGNTWESEAGKNLLMSMLVRMPSFPAGKQFFISEAVSLAIVSTLRERTGVECRVKWPNDIYAGDRKITGILISHSLRSEESGEATIAHSVLGVGLNVNQEEFHSDAPNPVSVFQLTGRHHDVEELTRSVAEAIRANLDRLGQGGLTAMHEEYMGTLWRGDGAYYPFYDVASGERFEASVYAVEPLGHLVLRTSPDGALRRYAFKEVVWL